MTALSLADLDIFYGDTQVTHAVTLAVAGAWASAILPTICIHMWSVA